MIKIAFYFEQESLMNYVDCEVKRGFSRRGISIEALPVNNLEELLIYANNNIIPDMFIFSSSTHMDKLLTNILFLKELNPSLISILSNSSDSINPLLKEEYHIMLQPFYTVSFSSHQQLWNCIYKAYEFSICNHNKFVYYSRPSYHSTSLSQILYFASEGRCIRLVTRNSSNFFYGKLDDLEENLGMKNCHFIRIHQSYLVNAKFIASFNHKSITLLTGEELRISKSNYYHEIKKTVKKK